MCGVHRVERAVAGSSSGADGRGGDDTDPALSTAIADLHKFSMMQSMYKSAVHLLDDLSSHAKRLDMPERAQVGWGETESKTGCTIALCLPMPGCPPSACLTPFTLQACPQHPCPGLQLSC